jgi:hypothetical protein
MPRHGARISDNYVGSAAIGIAQKCSPAAGTDSPAALLLPRRPSHLVPPVLSSLHFCSGSPARRSGSRWLGSQSATKGVSRWDFELGRRGVLGPWADSLPSTRPPRVPRWSSEQQVDVRPGSRERAHGTPGRSMRTGQERAVGTVLIRAGLGPGWRRRIPAASLRVGRLGQAGCWCTSRSSCRSAPRRPAARRW